MRLDMLKRLHEHAGTEEKAKPRLAIVSTYDDLCGIAGYTRRLVHQLQPHFETEVFDLDQFFMRSTHPNVRKLADRMIKDFCQSLRNFDFVNIQLEHGTFGSRHRDVHRRISWIAKAAPALSITFHTILPQEGFDVQSVIENLARLRLKTALFIVGNHFIHKSVTNKLYGMLRRQQKRKPVSIIVHTRRDMRLMRYVNKFSRVFDHPLAFWDSQLATELRDTMSREKLHVISHLDKDTKLIGVFGFISEYKGFDTVVSALHLLPKEYHLVFFGGLHPNEIKKGVAIHPYIDKLLKGAKVGSLVFDDIGERSVTLNVDASMSHLMLEHPKDLSKRIHFLGPQSDEEFAKAFTVCDVVVLPYLEIGQSSSGVLSSALEMGARIIAARNHAFIQFTRYHPNSIELFEVGNHVELAERILAPDQFPHATRPLRYNVETNAATYVAANSPDECLTAAKPARLAEWTQKLTTIPK
jgi:glycosyltransferase involved in cell wall biosynthesis